MIKAFVGGEVRTWYGMQKGKESKTYTLMYGVDIGSALCLERLKTA